ncbi:uncharacterized protein LOC127875320 isoform X2 [Dreissena polymorpha]|uniref:uncharacterized protein LOC127875320 isoform X2 n=1 Tax=Dreissena polymorpha TaxID=45954 RepID=UPI00226514EC|nr:uncharacterized protein LOC127875320 isoform X2 [Dreissena polymorpha]
MLGGEKTRVSDKAVLPVEVYAVKLTEDVAGHSWVTKSHIKEMLELVQGTVLSYLDSYSEKKAPGPSKVLSKPSDIITGTSVRVGYMFKDRPSHQTCLADVCHLMGTSHNECNTQLQSLSVLKQKLLIYAHPLTGCSQGTSQLLKVMREKRDSMGGSGVSISNYFQRIPSSQTGSQRGASQATNGAGTKAREPSMSRSSHPTSETVESATETKTIPQEPASEGRKTRIKNILDRGKIGKMKKKKSNTTPTTLTCKSNKEINDNGSLSNKDADADTEHLPLNEQKSDIVSCSASSNFKITRVSRNAMYLDCSIPVDPIVTEVKNADTMYQTGITVEPAEKLNNDVYSDSMADSGNQSDSSNSSFELPSINFQKKTSDNICLSEKVGKVETDKLDIDNRQADESSSPKFNQKRKVDQHDKNVMNEEHSSNKYNSESMKKKIEPEQAMVGKGLRRFAFKKRKLPKFSESDTDSSVSQTKRSKTFDSNSGVSTKNPDFSSSDSDEKANRDKSTQAKQNLDIYNRSLNKQVPEQKRPANNSRYSDEKFLKLNQMGQNTKRIKISNSFFTESATNLQPTLSYFMKNGNKENVNVTEENNSGAENSVDNSADLDCELMMEMCAVPRIKNEADVTLRDEVKQISHIENLKEDHLQYMVRNNEVYLRQIFEGKVHCGRHEAYKKGGISRQDLNYNSRIARFTDEQVEAVMETLQALFCKRHTKYLDYLIKVLLPEVLVKIHMDIHKTNHEESEKLLAHAFHPTLYHTYTS